MTQQNSLDPKVVNLLAAVRQQIRRFVVWETVLILLIVLLSAFWIALALDYLPVQLGGTEMPRSARAVLLVATLGLLGYFAIKLLLLRFGRPLPNESLALLVERHHPNINGRLVTAVQLCAPGRSGDSHAPELLRAVHVQASESVDSVKINRLLRFDRLKRLGLILAPLVIAVIALAVLSPSAFALAAKRLSLFSDDSWPRRADLDMVGIEIAQITADDEEQPPILIEFESREIRLPKGSSGTLRIQARAKNAVVPTLCTVHYTTDDGTYGQSSMRRVGRVVDGYQTFILDGAPLAGLSESMTLSIRGLDDRLDDYRVVAVDPPAITKFTVKARYPDYLRSEISGEFDVDTDYQAGLRVREGSRVTLVATSSVPMGAVDIALRTDSQQLIAPVLRYSDDRTNLEIELPSIDTSTMVRLVPQTTDGISAQAPYQYFMGVVVDEKPDVQLALSGIGSAVTPIARLPVTVTSADDYQVERLSLNIGVSSRDDDDESIDSNLGSPETVDDTALAPSLFTLPLQTSRDDSVDTTADLRELIATAKLTRITPGQTVSLFGEVQDGYDLDGNHIVRSEMISLEVVTAEQLLALLERRELGLRARLEQTIEETRLLRESIDLMRRTTFAADPVDVAADTTNKSANTGLASDKDENERVREIQLRKLRVQQSVLQADKTAGELSGIVAALDSLLQEMINNRVDSVDRRNRLQDGVRAPLSDVVDGPLAQLQDQIRRIERNVAQAETARSHATDAVKTAEDVLLRLSAILEKMLDLESYNEILDLVRGIIEDQEELRKETKEEQKRRVLDLFN